MGDRTVFFLPTRLSGWVDAESLRVKLRTDCPGRSAIYPSRFAHGMAVLAEEPFSPLSERLQGPVSRPRALLSEMLKGAKEEYFLQTATQTVFSSCLFVYLLLIWKIMTMYQPIVTGLK